VKPKGYIKTEFTIEIVLEFNMWLNPDFPKEFGSLSVAPCGGFEILFVAPYPRADARG
jgi:hypothetical protein